MIIESGMEVLFELLDDRQEHCFCEEHYFRVGLTQQDIFLQLKVSSTGVKTVAWISEYKKRRGSRFITTAKEDAENGIKMVAKSLREGTLIYKGARYV